MILILILTFQDAVEPRDATLDLLSKHVGTHLALLQSKVVRVRFTDKFRVRGMFRGSVMTPNTLCGVRT